MDFQSKHTVWITGAGSGIGRALAIQLADRGCSLIVSGRNEEKLISIQEELGHKCRVFILPFDLENPTETEKAVRTAMSFTGRIDVLFNNGGLSQRSKANSTPMDIHRKLMEVNYFSNISLTMALLPEWRKQGGGHVVVTSSLAGKTGFFLRSGYSASKHALHGFYDTLRLEEEENAIRVTLVCPNRVRTDISMSALDESGRPYGKKESRLETGIAPEACASRIIRATERYEREVLIGFDTKLAVWLKALFPGLFFRILRRQKTD